VKPLRLLPMTVLKVLPRRPMASYPLPVMVLFQIKALFVL
jgi:hypothetical protein